MGRQTVERSRVPRTLTHTWSESDSGGRPLGATMTVVNREIEKASDAATALNQFLADCKPDREHAEDGAVGASPATEC